MLVNKIQNLQHQFAGQVFYQEIATFENIIKKLWILLQNTFNVLL